MSYLCSNINDLLPSLNPIHWVLPVLYTNSLYSIPMLDTLCPDIYTLHIYLVLYVQISILYTYTWYFMSRYLYSTHILGTLCPDIYTLHVHILGTLCPDIYTLHIYLVLCVQISIYSPTTFSTKTCCYDLCTILFVSSSSFNIFSRIR